MSDTLFDEAMLREIVANQISERNPPHTTATLLRLTMKGMSRDEATDYIVCALAAELMAMEADGAPFNLERYQGFLDTLPEMPWADDEE
ncbi:hypothetical protein [Aeromonas schubertii]|uniref:hypothetical protein n=1 Tax=Aeromonas schubertii TaxID=652 RepID=UPI001CC40614|nr:hypothetical protein [Aeromonas schubertii]MBZ6073320.1 hypothetical protein [Aeromonas schubertii]